MSSTEELLRDERMLRKMMIDARNKTLEQVRERIEDIGEEQILTDTVLGILEDMKIEWDGVMI